MFLEKDKRLAEEIKEVKFEQDKTYSLSLECENCGRKIVLEIPFGTPLNDYAENNACDYCGVKGMIKKVRNNENK